VFDSSNGTLSFGADGYIELSGADSVSINGEIPKENFVRYEYASGTEELMAALEVDNTPYRKYNITVSSAVSLPGGTEIPVGTTVSIEMGGTLTFEGDAVNNGSIGIYEDCTLVIAEGYVLTNGEAYGKEIYLGIYDSADNWYEITDAEYEAIMAAQVPDDAPVSPESV
jgi:hypothetical protein